MWSLIKILNPNNLLSLFDDVATNAPTSAAVATTTSTVTAEAVASSSGLLSTLSSFLFNAVAYTVVIGASAYSLALVARYLHRRAQTQTQHDAGNSMVDMPSPSRSLDLQTTNYSRYLMRTSYDSSDDEQDYPYTTHYPVEQTQSRAISSTYTAQEPVYYRQHQFTPIPESTAEQIDLGREIREELAQAQAEQLQRQAYVIALNEYMQQQAAERQALAQAMAEQAFREQALAVQNNYFIHAQQSYATDMEVDDDASTDMDCSEITYGNTSRGFTAG